MRLADGDYWIDDLGFWNRAAFGEPCPLFANSGLRNQQRMDLAFRRLGMVRVSKNPETITIQWDIAEVCDESLNSACTCLWDLSGARRTKLGYYFGGWTREIVGSIRNAVLRIEELRRYRDVAPFSAVRIKPIEEGVAGPTPTPIIQRTRQLLAENGYRLDAKLCNRLAQEHLLDQLVLFQEEDGGGWLSYRHLGQRSLFSRVFGQGAVKQHIGMHCAVDPSENRNGYSVSRAYPQVMASGQDMVEQIFAPIRQANDDGVWISYQRLLARCRAPDGRKLLIVQAEQTEESLITA